MMVGNGFGLMRGMFCGLSFLLFWAVVIGLIVWAITAWSRSSRNRTITGSDIAPATPSAAPGGRALDILMERYARGEITKEQYDEMRRDLMV
jgi:putative membrane protein